MKEFACFRKMYYNKSLIHTIDGPLLQYVWRGKTASFNLYVDSLYDSDIRQIIYYINLFKNIFFS